jgi:hypothetical protein
MPAIRLYPFSREDRMLCTRAVRLNAAIAVISIVWLASPQEAQANLFKDRNKALTQLATSTGVSGAPSTRARPAAAGAKPTVKGLGARTTSPVIVAHSTGAGQTGYVHFFQIRLPDGELEIQVGIELSDRRIAWSFPGAGVTVSPFIEEGVLAAGGKTYDVWHLYGIRPFPDDRAMLTLQQELPARIDPWVKATTPYCGVDGLGADCMSCLGFVLRALYPGRNRDYPDLPADFWRAGSLGRYSTNDLLLYLTGMLDLPSREARLRRITQLGLPDELRTDLEELVYSMGVNESAPSVNAGNAPRATQKDTVVRKPRLRPAQRRRL